MKDITPVGSQVQINGQTYEIRPRATSDACFRALRRLAERRDREAASQGLKDAEEMLKQKLIAPDFYQQVKEDSIRVFTARATVTLQDMEKWLADPEGLATVFAVCCDEVDFDEALELVKNVESLGNIVNAIGGTLVEEQEAAGNSKPPKKKKGENAATK